MPAAFGRRQTSALATGSTAARAAFLYSVTTQQPRHRQCRQHLRLPQLSIYSVATGDCTTAPARPVRSSATVRPSSCSRASRGSGWKRRTRCRRASSLPPPCLLHAHGALSPQVRNATGPRVGPDESSSGLHRAQQVQCAARATFSFVSSRRQQDAGHVRRLGATK